MRKLPISTVSVNASAGLELFPGIELSRYAFFTAEMLGFLVE